MTNQIRNSNDQIVLLIDTSNRRARVELKRGREVVDFREWDFAFDLLEKIDEMLQERSLELDEIDRVEAHPGPGHFSALRSGIVTASLLSEALKIDLVDTESGEIVEIIEPVY